MAPPRRYPDAAAKQRAYRARQAQARRAEQATTGLPPTAPLPTLPSWARWRALIAQAQGLLQTAVEEMTSYGDERSEAWQESARAEELREQIAALEQILEDVAALLP